MRLVLILALGALGACAQFPEIDAANAAAPPAGDPPPLLSFAALKAATEEGSQPAAQTDDLEARSAALQGRAAILRRSAGTIDELEALREDLRDVQ